MARTVAGRQLTEQHRQGQLQVRARALRDFARVWPVWTGDEASFQEMLTVSLPLIRAYNGLSATMAGGYFDAFRMAENPGGTATAKLPPPLDEALVLGPLHVTGIDMTRRAIAAGASPQAARQTALVRATGTVGRQVLTGGRDTIVLSTAADKKAGGWERVTSGDPCAFCVLVASRGAVFSEDTADFQSHDHCSCSGEPKYGDSKSPGRNQEYRELYDRVASGTANPVNELRRAINGTE